MATTIPTLLDAQARRPAREPAAVDAVLAELDEALTGVLAEAGEAVAAALPVALTKARLTDAHGCEAFRRSTDERGASPAAIVGHLVDRLVAYAVVGEPPPDADPMRAAEAMLAADDDANARALGNLSASDRAAVEEAIRSRWAMVRAAWAGLDPSWWPRFEARARVRLAGGAVTAAGAFDVLLGGAASNHPLVVVEIKSGELRADHRPDAFWYALLLAARDRIAPSAVITWSAFDGTAMEEPVTAGTLRAAAYRAIDAVRQTLELAAGRPPQRSPGAPCGWCGDLACPVRPSDGQR